MGRSGGHVHTLGFLISLSVMLVEASRRLVVECSSQAAFTFYRAWHGDGSLRAVCCGVDQEKVRLSYHDHDTRVCSSLLCSTAE